MSEMSDWFAVPGHVPKSKALKTLICEGLLDWLVDEINLENAHECRNCMGEGCYECDDYGFIYVRHVGWRKVLASMRHSYVKPDPSRPLEDWYLECSDLDEGAEPVTVLDL